jgi:hypothetical protein
LDIKGIYSGSVGIDQKSSEHVKSHGFKSNLVIYIRGYGLGLNMDGSSSLQARSMDDFKDVMDYAFQSMQQKNVGMVHGIEIVSWVDNPQFQVAARLTDTQTECTTAPGPAPATTPATVTPPGTTPAPTPAGAGQTPAAECRPVSMELKKMNLVSNGEYIMTMNSILRMMLDSLYNMQFCRQMLHSFFADQAQAPLVNHRKFKPIGGPGTANGTAMTVDMLKVRSNECLDGSITTNRPNSRIGTKRILSQELNWYFDRRVSRTMSRTSIVHAWTR